MPELAAAVTAYIGLGANLGDPRAAVRAAMDALDAQHGITVTKRSSLYGSAPIDAGGDDYVNAVVQIETRLAPLVVLACLQAIEQEAGRLRPYRNAPRTLDLDLLLYGQQVQDNEVLTLPHPRMWQRAFVLKPLAELAPELVSAEQLQAVADQGVWLL
jgi:2-amino-4-hydroxy-6-hydroxymethyldihydropteridine diphosphokinase